MWQCKHFLDALLRLASSLMSLSALLLGASSSKKVTEKAIDSDLDAIFRSTAPSPSERKKKRKSRDVTDADDGDRDREVKKAKSKPKGEADGSRKKKVRISDVLDVYKEPVVVEKLKVAKTRAKAKKAESSDDEGDNEELENTYIARKAVSVQEPEPEPEPAVDSDEEGNPSTLVHESVANSGKSKGVAAKSKYIPEDETPDRRDARTIFIGNLSVEVAQKRVRVSFITSGAV